MRAQAKPPRPKWPWILAGLILAGLIAAAIYAVATRPTTPIEPTPTESTSSQPEVEPTGCLGGPGRDSAMLIGAARAAPHSTTGAVEFAASWVRWMHQFPNPSVDDARRAQEVFSASNVDFDLVGYLATQPNLSGGVVEQGRSFHSSTLPGVWHVEETALDKVTVSVGTAFVVDEALSSSLRGSITVTVVWEDGSWRFEGSEGTRTTEDLFSIGTDFTEGC